MYERVLGQAHVGNYRVGKCILDEFGFVGINLIYTPRKGIIPASHLQHLQMMDGYMDLCHEQDVLEDLRFIGNLGRNQGYFYWYIDLSDLGKYRNSACIHTRFPRHGASPDAQTRTWNNIARIPYSRISKVLYINQHPSLPSTLPHSHKSKQHSTITHPSIPPPPPTPPSPPPSRLPTTILLTGATSGIGKATLTSLLSHSHSSQAPIRAYIPYRNPPLHAPLLSSLRKLNPSAEIIPLEGSVSLLADVARICAQVKAREESLDVLFLCAGTLPLSGRHGTSLPISPCGCY